MPSYSNPEYASDKLQINPGNRGFWDLRLTGEYYQGLNVTTKKLRIDFRQTVSNIVLVRGAVSKSTML
jgi:hypothetical protein